jgi:cation-transporting ATPase E
MGEVYQPAVDKLQFSSSKKYGGVSFHDDETYLLGAPEVLLDDDYDKYSKVIDQYSSKGCRVLLLALYDGLLEDEHLTAGLMPLALILLTNRVREEAPETFKYFSNQGVTIKVISGDNPITVSEVARRAEIENAQEYIDARTLDTDEKIADAALRYTVFGRVTPEQKRKLIRAMKKAGHTVAMTGDGVNDVLALKEADCAIAMASGSDVASQSSHIVLLDSNFASMPSVVLEGRRVINNIERAASLFLVKNIFSFLLALVSLFFALPYPVSPAQLSLVSTLTIGIPSFILAMEPNESLVSGRFITNIIYRALPAGITNLLLVLGILLFQIGFAIPNEET